MMEEQPIMTPEERAIAVRRAGTFVDAAIRAEHHYRLIASKAQDLAVCGSLHDIVDYAVKAARHDDARHTLGGWINCEARLKCQT